ncbi:hypothetical protein C7999DRAFT_37344 [Corynascus novoguineensis]|uniref:Cytochrome P450 n=1 Tax=Corynascus novoguineensis TaxID=1126955 RepID=A0AAN7HUD0_9PEZI|nr:hypothetical protein C7999DRAFT_37344 [Corynascus novoguineensis]
MAVSLPSIGTASVLVGTCTVYFFLLLFRIRRTRRLQRWVHQQLSIANFDYAGRPTLEQRLRLRAMENHRLTAAYEIRNSLTTVSRSTHKDFLNKAAWILKRKDRSWKEVYRMAETFLKFEVDTALTRGRHSLCLAESVRCMVFAVVLFDSFQINSMGIPRPRLVAITNEINEQWLRSKRTPSDVAPSPLLNSTVASLNITSPFPDAESAVLSPSEVLSLIMPQYETLWRVVLLTFVTAYHHQPDAYPDTVQRTSDVPACLGDPANEKEALKLAKEGLRLYPSNKHLYRASPSHLYDLEERNAEEHNPSLTALGPAPVAADIASLHRHPFIWGNDALAFRPARFDDGVFTPLQRDAYLPFSLPPHKCPAAGTRGNDTSFGERMVVVLVVALGRRLGREMGKVVLGEEIGVNGELPTGRDEMEEWAWEGHATVS